LSTGLPFGGDEIAKTSNANGDVGSLTAGGGVMLGIGAMWTPLWLSQKRYGRANDSFAGDILGSFALSTHTIESTKFDATSFGISMGFHLNL